MKKNYLLKTIVSTICFLLFITTKTFALNYTISFTGTGVSTTIGSVVVQNITLGTSVTVPAGNVLNLTDSPNAIDEVTADNEFINVYSSSLKGKSTMSFYVKRVGITQITASSVDGRKITGVTTDLQVGKNSFELSLPKGIFVIQVIGNGYKYSTKIINQAYSLSKPQISYIGSETSVLSNQQKSKSSTLGTTQMTYNTGDRLLYKGISTNYSTIVTDIPTGSKNINFVFVECKDGDGNYYTVVTIGTQTWMAENLRTTKLSNGAVIPNITDNTLWSSQRTPAYCLYNNDVNNKTKYGVLYNWPAVGTGKLAPTGWRVPSNADWSTLTGTNVITAIALASNTDWIDPKTGGGIGYNLKNNNKYGFTGLPGGFRLGSNGLFFDVGTMAAWWSTTPINAGFSSLWMLQNWSTSVDQNSDYNQDGISVRCIKN